MESWKECKNLRRNCEAGTRHKNDLEEILKDNERNGLFKYPFQSFLRAFNLGKAGQDKLLENSASWLEDFKKV